MGKRLWGHTVGDMVRVMLPDYQGEARVVTVYVDPPRELWVQWWHGAGTGKAGYERRPITSPEQLEALPRPLEQGELFSPGHGDE